jgi:hypothetical protein
LGFPVAIEVKLELVVAGKPANSDWDDLSFWFKNGACPAAYLIFSVPRPSTRMTR